VPLLTLLHDCIVSIRMLSLVVRCKSHLVQRERHLHTTHSIYGIPFSSTEKEIGGVGPSSFRHTTGSGQRDDGATSPTASDSAARATAHLMTVRLSTSPL
jgi:hypothetical protein